jgi:hypothetical protein
MSRLFELRAKLGVAQTVEWSFLLRQTVGQRCANKFIRTIIVISLIILHIKNQMNHFHNKTNMSNQMNLILKLNYFINSHKLAVLDYKKVHSS